MLIAKTVGTTNGLGNNNTFSLVYVKYFYRGMFHPQDYLCATSKLIHNKVNKKHEPHAYILGVF